MIAIINKLNYVIDQLSDFVKESSEETMSRKLAPEKWSKKELIGHLIDSGVNNLKRFTEIQFAKKPYALQSYMQNELVQANNYQIAETHDLLDFLVAINKRIIAIIKLQTDKTLSYEIVTYENVIFDLKYLIEDYMVHFEHHTKQIIE